MIDIEIEKEAFPIKEAKRTLPVKKSYASIDREAESAASGKDY